MARKVLAILSNKYYNISNREIAKNLNLSESSISKIIRESQDLTEKIEAIISSFER
ncbi:winged helix-turn-helix transcriptional regulator [Wukongibacter sp. M2B1]|uniref:winged helix-turn-helix transcriptional regulator n=1 Tax=Wukongibacter sp. M2B1 TaxID=3088895 RepID=UPI003D7AC68A